jgi:hypothetical protein
MRLANTGPRQLVSMCRFLLIVILRQLSYVMAFLCQLDESLMLHSIQSLRCLNGWINDHSSDTLRDN